MNTYELELHLKIDISQDRHELMSNNPNIHHIECDESSLVHLLHEISEQGILLEYGNDRVYIPGKSIKYIVVKFLERAQVVPDVSDSIKAVLKEE